LLGQYHSMHELWDLARALSYQAGQLQKGVICAHGKQWDGTFDATTNTWVSSNADVTTWLDNYNNAYAAFGVALDRANEAMSTFVSWALWDVTPATDAQGNIFDALVKAFDPLIACDLSLRQPSLGFPKDCYPVYPDIPQPTAPDFSLDAYKMASAVTGAVDSAGHKVKEIFDSDGVMLATASIIMVAGAVIAVQVVSLLPKARGR